MTDWREELIEKMAKATLAILNPSQNWDDLHVANKAAYILEARAALAVAEPVIREQCAEAAAAIAKEHLTDTVAAIVAAAIREGGDSA